MTIRTNCTNDRKVMVRRLAAHLGVQAEYLGVPHCGYRVGELTVDRNAVIVGVPELLQQITPFLMENGYIHEAPQQPADLEAAQTAEETVAPAEEAAPEENTEESTEDTTQEIVQDDSEAPAEDTQETEVETATEEGADGEPDSKAEPDSETDPQHITQMCVSIPLVEFTAPTLTTVLKLVYARQSLIAAMTQSDRIYIHEELIDLLQDEKPDTVERICELLQGEINADMVRGIEIQENRFTLNFPFDEAQPTRWTAYADLLTAIVNRAKTAHHISGKRLDPEEEEMKYFCRNWLIQLGLGGAEHKETQHILLGHLKGYAAFRSAAKMDAHKAKHAALRKECREENRREEH